MEVGEAFDLGSTLLRMNQMRPMMLTQERAVERWVNLDLIYPACVSQNTGVELETRVADRGIRVKLTRPP